MDNNDSRPRRNTSGVPTPHTPTDSPSSPDHNQQPTTPISSGGRLRALTDLPQSLLRGRSTGWSPSDGGPSYSPLNNVNEVDHEELSPTRRPQRVPPPNIHLNIPQNVNASAHGGSSPDSPLDAAEFQAAMAGLPPLGYPSLTDNMFANHSGVAGRYDPRPNMEHMRQESLHSIVTANSFDQEGGTMLDVPLTDTTPLAPHAAPVAGRSNSDVTMPTSPSGTAPKPHGPFGPRLSTRMLGDDLPRAEEGSLSPGGSGINRSPSMRTLSPTSPLTRGRTILRQMSQRIVNLSNEQDVVERAIRRRPSMRDAQPSNEIEMITIPPLPTFGDGEDDRDDVPLDRVQTAEEIQTQPLQRQSSPRWGANPFKGKSLGVFSPDNKLRMFLCDILVHPWTEPTIFLLIILQTILLAVDCYRPAVYDVPASLKFGTPIDYCLLVLFAIYTVELATRMVVSGFIINPHEHSTINRHLGWRRAIIEKLRTTFGDPHVRRAAAMQAQSTAGPHQPSLLRSLTMPAEIELQGDSRLSQRRRLARRAFLRHSFNRLDFIAVTAFWISFVMQLFAFETGKHVAVFRMLSCLRIMRLLYLTSGTTVIVRSVKKAAPLLLNVGFLICFFWLIFAIIGVQSFKSSLRRQCVWIDPTNPNNNYTNSFVFCGGYLNNITYQPEPWVTRNPDGSFTPGTKSHKGYLCPVQSICLDNQNPYNGSVSFDNIANSLELVFVMMSSNTFSDILYYLTNSDYLSAAIYFAVGIVILFFWLVNLLIAVITSSFQVIREESKASAFTGQDEDRKIAEEQESLKSPRTKKNSLLATYKKTEPFWVVVITYGIIAQGFRSASMSTQRTHFVNLSETAVTIILLVEILLRFLVDWRGFFRKRRNLVDLGIAIITTIIQIPPIHNSGTPYAWLTFFQIIRIYRVVLALPITRDLIIIMLGNFTGLLNLILFVFLFCFLAAILATQMFRGSLPQQDWNQSIIKTQFDNLWNSFLGMYQVFSSENWTDIMYHVTNYDMVYNTAWVGAAFFIMWFIIANFITMNMFIAVIQENFDVSEDEKRLQQVKAFLEQREYASGGHGNLALSNIFRYGLISGRRQDPSAYGSATTELLLRDAVVRDFLDQNDDPSDLTSPGMGRLESDEKIRPLRPAPNAMVRNGTMSSMWTTFVGRLTNQEPNPFYSRVELNQAAGYEIDPRSMAQHAVQSHNLRRRAQREYLIRHPMYNVSLYIFRPDSKIRRFCQRIVGPGRGGDRIEGVQPSVPVWYAFSAFIYVAIVAMVILACITTPLYQKEYFQRIGRYEPYNWFVWSDSGFAVVFTIEAVIKVIADGFFWTPNAYFRSSWGFIDGIVLITLWINVISALFSAGEVSRAVGAFKALRALRLLNISDSARENFHSVIIRGGIKIVSAAFVSLSLLIPFAIYGLNLFSNKMNSCNDTYSGIFDLNDCVNEFGLLSPFNWNVYAPRVVGNSYFNFDDFANSLFILFQIVSQEGWIDVMWAGQSITGVFKQPRQFASTGNAIFFVIFNLLGAVFVLTLFVSVFMRNYTEMTGVAFLTADQRSWLELRKLLRQISPSKRPVNAERQSKHKRLLYRWAVTKTGFWQRFVTAILIFHLALLCAEFSPSVKWWDETRDFLFLVFTLVYMTNIVIRILGLTWPRFIKSSWDVYSIVAVFGTFISTLLVLAMPDSVTANLVQKLFLVSIALLLIPRNNQLDQLFKTAAASLPLIVNLMATWFVLFLVFAIAMTQAFSLTRFGANETVNINLRNVPKAMILLFRMSVGEGWNQIMKDFASVRPPFCVEGNIYNSDCGSASWAYFLFVAWNILSMYIFVNLFISLIYESFSYVYQYSSGLSIISREDIRRFKEAWAVVDPDGTGYINKDALPKLLRELSGVFEMRIYEGDYSVKRLIDDCSKTPRESTFSTISHQQVSREIDLAKLNARLSTLPVAEIRRRRIRLQQFYEEVIVSSERDRGIAFNSLLMILAHYKVINDNKSLRLNEFLRRRARLQRVDEAVRRQIVIGFFDTCYWRRYFRMYQARQRAGRMQSVPQLMVPEIYVEDQDSIDGGGGHSRNASVDGYGFHGSGASTPHSSDASGMATPPPRNSIQISPVASPPSMTPQHLTPQHTGSDGHGHPAYRFPSPPPGGAWAIHGRRPSLDVPHLELSPGMSATAAATTTAPPLPGVDGNSSDGGLSADGGRSRANSAVSVQGVLDALDASAWGESIRRSFSTRRPGQQPSRRGRSDTAGGSGGDGSEDPGGRV